MICKFSKTKQYFITATNHGEVKIWDYKGDLKGMVNQANYPSKDMIPLLVETPTLEKKTKKKPTKIADDFDDI